MKLKCYADPCITCPYRKDTPAGIWDKSEYDKLPAWDNPNTFAGTFLCHNSNREAICRGWAEVHSNNLGVRIALIHIEWNDSNRNPTKVALYPSGKAARSAGLKGVKRPSPKAKRAITRILLKRDATI